MISTGPQVAIRRATPADSDQVAEIWRRGWQDGHRGSVPPELVKVRTDESFNARASDRVDDTTVATVEGVVAGFVMVVDDEVEQVYVSARHRGSGLAAILMDEAERLVRGNGYAIAWLAVVDGNGRARAFYEKAGWQDEGPFDYAVTAETGPIVVPARRYTKRLSGSGA